MIFVDLCGGKKMFLYFFVRGTFLKIGKKRQFQNQGRVLTERRIQRMSNVNVCTIGHNEDEQLFFDRIIFTAKNAWDRGGQILQDFASYFSSHYFPIIGTSYPIYSYYLVYIFKKSALCDILCQVYKFCVGYIMENQQHVLYFVSG